MTWIFMLFMHGYIIEVDSFISRQTCLDKVRQYNRAAEQSGSIFLVWCESRPRA
jgi:hypothetical protein